MLSFKPIVKPLLVSFNTFFSTTNALFYIFFQLIALVYKLDFLVNSDS